MKSQSYLVILLALTTLGGAGVAWNQYRELTDLRAAALTPAERAEWQKRAWDLEARNRELQDELAARQVATGDNANRLPPPDSEPPPEGPPRGGQRGGRGPAQFAALRELVNKPEVQALMRVQQKAAIDSRYAAFFHSLNLAPEQADKLKDLLVERQTTLQDVMNAAREQGINPRNDPEGFRQLVADAQSDITNGIKGLIGDNGLAQLQNYEQTLPQRNLVNDLQQRLSYTNSPLTPTQADQLVQILATTSPQRANTANDFPAPPPGGRGGFGGMAEIGGLVAGAMGGGMGGPAGGATARVTADAVAQAQTVLAPPQVAALKQIQEQQQSQQQLQKILRDTVTNPPAGQNATGGGGTRRKGGG